MCNADLLVLQGAEFIKKTLSNLRRQSAVTYTTPENALNVNYDAAKVSHDDAAVVSQAVVCILTRSIVRRRFLSLGPLMLGNNGVKSIKKIQRNAMAAPAACKR
jgi:hypothetical protein